MKTLYYTFAGYGTVFLDEKGKMVHYIHENDADWRPEYHDSIIEFFGGNMIFLKSDNLDIDDIYDDGAEEKIRKWFLGKMEKTNGKSSKSNKRSGK